MLTQYDHSVMPLIIGSNDAGRQVHADDPRGNQLMLQAAQLLNLKGNHHC